MHDQLFVLRIGYNVTDKFLLLFHLLAYQLDFVYLIFDHLLCLSLKLLNFIDSLLLIMIIFFLLNRLGKLALLDSFFDEVVHVSLYLRDLFVFEFVLNGLNSF